MEEYIGPDGRRKVRMTQSEFNAANGIKPALVANSPLRPPVPPQAPQPIYPGQSASLAPETPVPAFVQGMAGWPGEGVQHGLGNAARSLAVMAPFGLATGGLGAVGYGLGMVGGGAMDRVITKNLEAGYTSTPRTAGEQVRSAVEGGAMGLGSALLGGAAGTVAGKFLPVAAGEAPRLGTQAAMAAGEALGWEGVSAPVEGRSFSPTNVAQDMAFFGALKGVEGVPGLGARLTSAISPEQALAEANILPDLPPALAQAQPSAQLAPMNDVPLTDVPMGRAQTEAFIDEINATLMRRKQGLGIDPADPEVLRNLMAAISKPAPYDYVPPVEPGVGEVSLRPEAPPLAVEAIPSRPAEMPMLPERSAPPARQALDPLASQPLSDPSAPMTKGDMAEFLDSLNKQIEARNKSRALEPMGEPLPAPTPRTKPALEEPVLPGAPIEDYQRRSMLGRAARQEGNPGIAPTPEVFEPMGGGGGYVGPPQPERPTPREFEQPFIPGDRNEPDFRSLVPTGEKIQTAPNTNSPEISMKLVDEKPAPKPGPKSADAMRREWIDRERETNPAFAPDVDSWKETLSPEDLSEVLEWEDLRYKTVAMQGRAAGYKPYKLSAQQKSRLDELNRKYIPRQRAEIGENTPKPSSDTPELENSAPESVESVISEGEPAPKAQIPPEPSAPPRRSYRRPKKGEGGTETIESISQGASRSQDFKDLLMAPQREAQEREITGAFRKQFIGDKDTTIASGDIVNRDWEKLSQSPLPTEKINELIDDAVQRGATAPLAKPEIARANGEYGKKQVATLRSEVIPSELSAARLAYQNQDALINGRLTRNQTVAPYLEKRRDALLDTLDKKLEESYPGIGPDERAAFIDSGKVPSRTKVLTSAEPDVTISTTETKAETAGGSAMESGDQPAWGMTQQDYVKSYMDSAAAKAKADGTFTSTDWMDVRVEGENAHKAAVDEAIRNGNFVPDDVLSDYPDAASSVEYNDPYTLAENKRQADLADTANGFLDGKPQVRRAAIQKALSKKFAFSTGPTDIRNYIENRSKKGELTVNSYESGGKTVYTVNDLKLGKTAYDYAKHLLDNPPAQTPTPKRSLLNEERGAAIRPGEVIKGIKERISEAAANTPAAKTKAFVAKQKELRKKYHAASYEEKVQIREELIATNEAFQKDLGLDPERVKSLYEERVTKGLTPTFTADTTPYEGKNRVELAAIAKEMGVPIRGTNDALIQQIANKAELRRINRTPGRTPEQLQDSISRVTKTYKEATQKKGVRGTIKNFVRGVDAALIDSRNPMKKENRARFGEAGEDANRLAEKAVTSPVHVQVEVNETIDSIFGDLDSKTPVKRADYYENPAFTDEDLVTERDLLNELIVAKSSYELAKKRPDHLFTNGNTEADFKATLDAIEASPSGEKLLAKADEYFSKMQEMVEDLYDAGVITEKYRDELLENQHYMPRKVFKEDVNAGIDTYLYKINMNDTLHEPLSGGSLEAIENDSALLMAHVIQRTRQRIANNDTAVELIRLFDEGNLDAKDGFAVRKTKAQQEAPVPTGHSTIKGFVDGVEQQLIAPEWYVDSYRGHDKHRANETAVKLAKFSGAGLLRESATGALAPYFFTRNFAKDVVHLWQTQDAYSAALPKAAYDIVKDVWAVKGDAWQGLNGRRAKGLLREYLRNGGGGATMTEYTNSARGGGGKFKGFLHAMGSMNQWSEQAVRLAHYKHLIDKGVDPRAAAAAARDRINFSQGGWLTKNMNLIAPYTNARVQGTRSLVAAAKRDPKRFAAVQAQSLGLSVAKAAAIYAAGEWADDQIGNPLGRIYDMISDEEKVHNHIIPTPFGRTEKGVFKPFYFRIAKDESEKIPTYIGEQIGRIFSGRAPNWQPLEEVISGSTVASDIGSFVPPVFQAFLAYAGNYDLFRREYVYKGGDVTDPNFGIDDRSLERKNANDFFQDAGALTGLSPDGTQAALGKLLNGGNPMWGPFSEGYSVMKAMAGGDIEREKEISQHYADMLFSMSGGVGRFVRSDAAAVGVQIAENRRTNRESVLQNEEIEKLTSSISKASDVAPAMRKGFGWVNTLPVEQRGAVARRLVNAAEMKTYPEEVQGLARELFWMKEPKLQALNYLNSQLSGDKERRKTASIAFGASGAASDGQTQLYYSKLEGKFREKLKAAKGGAKSSIDLKSEAAWLDMP